MIKISTPPKIMNVLSYSIMGSINSTLLLALLGFYLAPFFAINVMLIPAIAAGMGLFLGCLLSTLIGTKAKDDSHNPGVTGATWGTLIGVTAAFCALSFFPGITLLSFTGLLVLTTSALAGAILLGSYAKLSEGMQIGALPVTKTTRLKQFNKIPRQVHYQFSTSNHEIAHQQLEKERITKAAEYKQAEEARLKEQQEIKLAVQEAGLKQKKQAQRTNQQAKGNQPVDEERYQKNLLKFNVEVERCHRKLTEQVSQSLQSTSSSPCKEASPANNRFEGKHKRTHSAHTIEEVLFYPNGAPISPIIPIKNYYINVPSPNKQTVYTPTRTARISRELYRNCYKICNDGQSPPNNSSFVDIPEVEESLVSIPSPNESFENEPGNVSPLVSIPSADTSKHTPDNASPLVSIPSPDCNSNSQQPAATGLERSFDEIPSDSSNQHSSTLAVGTPITSSPLVSIPSTTSSPLPTSKNTKDATPKSTPPNKNHTQLIPRRLFSTISSLRANNKHMRSHSQNGVDAIKPLIDDNKENNPQFTP